ncbi:tautomerase family protein [Bacillus infantis]|uniref:4-oxalocrotonate tautomerase n=1 Tax=Bacillus infantis TaxID=324767 RepID=A0A5D4RAZ2_9BACI|nr:tautomerase family protein [Bacillus infantis]TYS48537.1 4-oxalocrotonate tautomerase [Bacillus infantis]
MPIIQVQVLEGRSDEKIRELIAGITDSAVNILEVKPEQVRVIVQPVPMKYWDVGGRTRETAHGTNEHKHKNPNFL